jgi:hypothetical protein
MFSPPVILPFYGHLHNFQDRLKAFSMAFFYINYGFHGGGSSWLVLLV